MSAALNRLVLAAVGLLAACAQADTFTNAATGDILHGYIVVAADGGMEVMTAEKGRQTLNRMQWSVAADRLGRNYQVVVVSLDASMSLEMETEAMVKAIVEASGAGPLFILLEIDTPGGQIGLCRQMCAAITEKANCPVMGFVKGGEHGGALSAGAAVALACDKLYMAPNTTIGAATAIVETAGTPEELDSVYGHTIGGKISSAWEAQLAALAERNGRPAIVAKAMVDKDIDVVEVADEHGHFFVDAGDMKVEQRLVRRWGKKGTVLTLTASEAVDCRMADKIVDSRQAVLEDLNAAGAEVIVSTAAQDARIEFSRARKKLDRLLNSIDARAKQSQVPEPLPWAMRNLREAIADYREVIAMGRRYKDLNVNVTSFERALNSLEAAYDQAKVDLKNSGKPD